MDTNIIIDEPPSRETMPLSPGKKFHIIVSYRDVSRDKLWVKKVIGKLETEYGYICCDHERDFLPGTKVMDNIKDGVKNSEKVVVVFSKEAIDSHHLSQKEKAAYIEGFETRENIPIPVLLNDCDVPEEFMHATYIDAREGVEETSWWPKLIKSIQSTAGKTFALTQLCTIETKFNYRRYSIQVNPEDTPAKWQPQAFGVPVDLIRATYKNLLRSPRVECRQQFCCFASCCVVTGCAIFALFLLYSINGMYYIAQPKMFGANAIACIFFLSLLGNCYLPYKLIFVKEYVIRHLRKEGITHTAEHRDIPNSDRKMASTGSSSRLSGVGKQSRSREGVDSSRQHAHAASQTYMNPCYSDIENKSHDCETMFNEEEDTENKAMELLMWYTPEYLDLAYANKLKNPKEDRHGIKLKCLCQYLEEVDEDFREKVERTK